LQGLKQETEEDVCGKQYQREHDGAAQAAPSGHAVALLLLFLAGLLLACGSFLGSFTIAGKTCVAIGCGRLFHAWLVRWRSGGVIFRWRAGVKGDISPWTLGWNGRLLVAAGADPGLGNGLAGLQQALRANDDAVVGDETLVADFELFTAFWTGPAHSLVNS